LKVNPLMSYSEIFGAFRLTSCALKGCLWHFCFKSCQKS